MREKIAGRGLLAGYRIIHLELREVGADGLVPVDLTFVSEDAEGESREGFGDRADGKQGCGRDRDRKSTRLNSSHGYISYAVFCLKKKKSVCRRWVNRDLTEAIQTLQTAQYPLQVAHGP